MLSWFPDWLLGSFRLTPGGQESGLVLPSLGTTRCSGTYAGLYDLMGNVWEWTASPYQAADQDMRVLRGASWIDTADGSANHRARVTTR